MRVVVGEHLADSRHDILFEGRILSLRPPLGDLRQTRGTEVLVDRLVGSLVGREECEEVAHTALAQSGCEMVH